jgi:hypothetical protein
LTQMSQQQLCDDSRQWHHQAQTDEKQGQSYSLRICYV